MGQKNLLSFMFSCLLTYYKVANGKIFTTVLQKYKLNSAHIQKDTKYLCNVIYKLTKNLCKITTQSKIIQYTVLVIKQRRDSEQAIWLYYQALKTFRSAETFLLKVACIIKKRQLFNENFCRLKLTKQLFADKYHNPQ